MHDCKGQSLYHITRAFSGLQDQESKVSCLQALAWLEISVSDS